MKEKTIYLLEDDKNLNKILKKYIEAEKYNVKTFELGFDAIDAVDENPDLWVLDVMLPDIDGFEVIKKIKLKYPDTPVIFISARDQSLDRVIGLEMGGDDYLPKPFIPRELIIKINRYFEKSSAIHKSDSASIISSTYSFNINERKVYDSKNQEIILTSLEFDLLYLMVTNPQKAFSRENLLSQIWGDDYFGSDRVVDDLIRRVRKKMPNLNIETIYGFGYRYNE